MEYPRELLQADIKEALGLTDDQTSKIKAILPAKKLLRHDVEEGIDIEKFVRRMVDIQKKMAVLTEEIVDDIGSILSLEQRAKLALFMGKRFQDRKESGQVGPLGKLLAAIHSETKALELTDKQKEG